MKTWMKILMWLGIGGGIGFIGGYRMSDSRKARAEKDAYDNGYSDGWHEGYRNGYDDCESGEAPKSISYYMREYRGTTEDGTFSSVEDLDEYMRDEAGKQEEDAEDPGDIPKEEDLRIDDEEETEKKEIPQMHPTWVRPVEISDEEFSHNPDGMDQHYLVFYSVDEVLYDETEQKVIGEPNNEIGIGTLDAFGGDPKNPKETIFMKNETFGRIYRIDRVEGSFMEEVDGTAPSPSEYDEEEDFTEEDLD